MLKAKNYCSNCVLYGYFVILRKNCASSMKPGSVSLQAFLYQTLPGLIIREALQCHFSAYFLTPDLGLHFQNSWWSWLQKPGLTFHLQLILIPLNFTLNILYAAFDSPCFPQPFWEKNSLDLALSILSYRVQKLQGPKASA